MALRCQAPRELVFARGGLELRAKVNDHTRELGCGEGDGRMFESACARVDGIRRRLDGWRGRAIIRLEEGVGLLELADEAEGHGWTKDLATGWSLLVEWNENDDDNKYRRQAGEGWYNKCETINHFEAEIIIDALSLSADSILDLEEQGSRPCRKHLFAKHEFPTSLSRDSDIPCPATGDRFIRDKSKEVNPIILVTFRGCCHTYVRQICLRIEMCRHRTIAKSSSGCDGHRGRM
ncbi:hypothetical protein F5146DRAFT_1122418 [Armillaria mellea]|nr:hypothetical protein F5146DRAFT_1122418 [Armillaria mellea]